MKTPWLLVICVVGLAISGAALIWMVPSLFDATRQSNGWLMIALAGLGITFSVAAIRLRRAESSFRP